MEDSLFGDGLRETNSTPIWLEILLYLARKEGAERVVSLGQVDLEYGSRDIFGQPAAFGRLGFESYQTNTPDTTLYVPPADVRSVDPKGASANS